MKTCSKESPLQYGRVATCMAKSALPTCTSVSALPTCSQKPNQIGSNRKDQRRARTLRGASPTFTCVTAASLPAVSAASWRSPRHSLLPSRPGAASSLSFAPALPAAAVFSQAAQKCEAMRAWCLLYFIVGHLVLGSISVSTTFTMVFYA